MTVILSILLAGLYYVIFQFSAQDSVQSTFLSQRFSERCVQLISAISGANWSDAVLQEMAVYFEHPIRKLAHFSEYACMGILVYTLWGQWMRHGKRLCLLTFAWVFVSAAVDEFHQYFVPGRYASFLDVLLDTCGGAFGMFCCIWLSRLWCRLCLRMTAP